MFLNTLVWFIDSIREVYLFSKSMLCNNGISDSIKIYKRSGNIQKSIQLLRIGFRISIKVLGIVPCNEYSS